ncbi:MAG: hypothetical protein ACLFUR_05020 [Candidatus Hadarchaeia archaeon]
MIVVGDLKGLRENGEDKGRMMNWIISNFPYHKFVKYWDIRLMREASKWLR